MKKKKENKENKDLEIQLEDVLSNIFDEDFNINMKQIFGIAPVELVSLIIKEKKNRLGN